MKFKTFKHLGYILLGNLCTALGAVFFVIPFGFVGGGLTGLAMALQAAFGLPTSTGVALLQAFFLLLGLIFLGKAYTIKSLFGVVSYPILFWLMDRLQGFAGLIGEDPMLAMICAVLLYGAGISLILGQGAGSGGVDVISMVLHKKFGLPLGPLLSIVDVLIVLLQAPFFTVQGILQGTLVILGYSFVMSRFLASGISRIQVQIFSPQYQAINDMILYELNRGTTLFHVTGGHLREQTCAVQTILHRRDLFALKEKTLAIDPHAFIVVSHVTEVSGRGFTLDQVPRPKA